MAQDRDYHNLIRELLAGVGSGWSYAAVKGWLISDRLQEGDLARWLREHGEELGADAAIRSQLGCLAGLGRGELAEVAVELVEGWEPQVEEWEEWFDRGNELLELGRYEEAIDSFDRVIKLKPDYYQAWVNRGVALGNLGRYSEEIASYDRVIELNPHLPEAWSNRGVVLQKLDRSLEGIANFNRATEIKPDFHQAWNNRGLSFDNLGQYEEAIASFDRAIEIDHNYDDAWFRRGNALNNLGRYLEAIVSYDRAIEIKSDYHEVWHNRAVALDNLGRYLEAIVSYDRAIEINPDFYEPLCCRGAILCDRLGRYEEAIASFDQAIELKSDYYEAWHNRGVALGNLGRYSEEIASYDRAIEIKPNYYQAWCYRGVSFYSLSQYEEAIPSFDRAIEIQPDYYDAWCSRGSALGYLERCEEAIASLDRAIKIKPDLPQAWANRGIVIYNLKGYLAAIDAYHQAFQHIHPDTHPEGWGFLQHKIGRAHYQEGKKQLLNYRKNPQPYYDRAITAYHNALTTLTRESFPELRLETLIDLSKVYLAQHNPEAAHNSQAEAVDIFRDLLNTQPTFAAKKRLQLKYSGLRQFDLDLFVDRRDNIRALEAAELDKNERLTWLLSGFEQTTISPDYEQMKGLFVSHTKTPEISKVGENPPKSPLKRGTLTELEYPEHSGMGGSPSQSSLASETLKAPFVRGLEDSALEPKPETPEVFATTAIVYWHLSEENLTTFIVTPADPQPILWESDRSYQAREFNNWLGEWDRDYNDYRAKKTPNPNHPWRQQLTQRLTRLNEILEIDKICDRLPANLTRLTLIPHRDLHRFPLHIFFLTTRKLTKLQGCVYLPSIQIGLNLYQRATPPVYTPLLSICDPQTEQPELEFARIESAIVRCLLQPHSQQPDTEIDRESADVTTVKNAIAQPHATFHFTGHAAYDPRTPEVSAIALTGGLLTAEEIWQLDLSSYHLVNLAACETAITGRKDISTEYVGLASAFLHAGAGNILSTLWQVDQQVNAWFTIYFCQQLLAAKSPAVALTITQVWMKTLTWQKFLDWLHELLQLPLTNPWVIRKLKGTIEAIEQREGTMGLERLTEYSDTYAWAAFTLMGRG